MIDTGSAHNFLDVAMISILQLSLDSTLSFEVKVANTIMTHYVCSNVKITKQGNVFSVDLNALPLGDCELVLGTQLLRTFGLI